MFLTDVGVQDRAKRASVFIPWNKIERIRGVKLDKITYEENFIVVQSEDMQISLGELDKNFDEIEGTIRHRFPNIPPSWRAELEGGREDIVLWEKP